jgi:hypothetical protein
MFQTLSHAQTSKIMWVALITDFIMVFAPIGVVLAIVHLSSVRSKIDKFI